MNRPFLLSTLLFCFSFNLFAQPDTLRLKGSKKVGALAFDGSSGVIQFRNMGANNPWQDTKKPLRKLPEGWSEFYRKDFWFQAPQFAFQNYKAGKMSEERIAGLMESWEFDTIRLSKNEIRCSIDMVYRRNEGGEVEYALDLDGDMDFSNEKVYQSLPGEIYDSLELRNIVIENAPKVYYEVSTSLGVVQDSIPLVIGLHEAEAYGEFLVYYMPEYREVIYQQDTLIVRCDRPDFKDIEASQKKTIGSEQFGIAGEKLSAGDIIQLASEWYKIKNYDRGKEELVLTTVDAMVDTVHPQAGFYAPDFTIQNHLNGEALSLDQFEGKFLILDFWGTWCTGCVQALPEFVEFHNKLKGKPVEILSVACFSDGTNFNKLREKHGMNWLHAWQTQDVGILEDYQVSGYPVYFLIGPDGKILNRTLFLSELEKNLLAHLQE